MEVRKSYTALHKIYFWTATIHNWIPLLASEENKNLIVRYLKKLSGDQLITVYGFVLMPTHIHFIWSQNGLNGKETPKGSFLKYSAHEFLKTLKLSGEAGNFRVNMANKQHQIWQRDSLGIEIYNKAVAKQKLDYIHFNPISKKWNLAQNDLGYFFSSARFYEDGVDEFGFLKNIFQEF